MLSRTPPPPPSAPQPVAPTLLRRPQIPTPLSAASWPSAASALSSGSPRPSAGMFWEISPPPPPPPASGVRLAQDSTTHVSESTVPPRSFVDAVRRSPGASSSRLAPQPLPRPTLKSVFTVPSPRRDAYRRAYELAPRERRDILPHRRTTPRPAFTPAEPGWTEVKPRRWWREKGHLIHGQWPDSRREDGAGRRAALSLEEFKARTRGRCFVCLARDHRESACRDPPRCSTCFRTGHRARHCNSSHPTYRPLRLDAKASHAFPRTPRADRSRSPRPTHRSRRLPRAACASPRTSRSRFPSPRADML